MREKIQIDANSNAHHPISFHPRMVAANTSEYWCTGNVHCTSYTTVCVCMCAVWPFGPPHIPILSLFFYLNDIPFQLFFFFSHFVPSLLFTPRPIPIAISSLDWSPLCVCASWFCVPKSRCHSHILPICACDSHGRWKEWDGRRVGGGHHICRWIAMLLPAVRSHTFLSFLLFLLHIIILFQLVSESVCARSIHPFHTFDIIHGFLCSGYFIYYIIAHALCFIYVRIGWIFRSSVL